MQGKPIFSTKLKVISAGVMIALSLLLILTGCTSHENDKKTICSAVCEECKKVTLKCDRVHETNTIEISEGG